MGFHWQQQMRKGLFFGIRATSPLGRSTQFMKGLLTMEEEYQYDIRYMRGRAGDAVLLAIPYSPASSFS